MNLLKLGVLVCGALLTGPSGRNDVLLSCDWVISRKPIGPVEKK